MMLETLEQRLLLAVFTVTSTDDAGPGSLRQAIIDANNNPGHDEVLFDIPGSGVRSIGLLTPLPSISEPLTIDGYSQSGASPNTLAIGNNAVLLVELSGDLATPGPGLDIAAGQSLVRGLVINGFAGPGIHIHSAGQNVIEGNFIGTDASGAVARPNQAQGIFILLSPQNRIGGDGPEARNVISANASHGIEIFGSGA
jgi:hypothetical protein